MEQERIDHTTGNIWRKDDTGHMVCVGNIMDPKKEHIPDKVSTTMSQKEGLMQSCCTEYNNIHPVSWRNAEGQWHLAWRCEICQRVMELVINAKNSFPYIVNATPIEIPKGAIVIEHTKPDLQQLRAIEGGVEIYRQEREKAVPSELILFDGACPNCAYQPLSGKATADHSTVYKCTTCGSVYKIKENGEYYRYYGTTDLDPVEEVSTDTPDTDTGEDTLPEEVHTAIVEDIPTALAQIEDAVTKPITKLVLYELARGSELPAAIAGDPPSQEAFGENVDTTLPDVWTPQSTPIQDTEVSGRGSTTVISHWDDMAWTPAQETLSSSDAVIPAQEESFTNHPNTEENSMSQTPTTEMVHPTNLGAEQAVASVDDIFGDAPAQDTMSGLEGIDLTTAMTMDAPAAVVAPTLHVTGSIPSMPSQIRSDNTVSLDEVLSIPDCTIVELNTSLNTQKNVQSLVQTQMTSHTLIYCTGLNITILHNHVPTAVEGYVTAPHYKGEPATFLKLNTVVEMEKNGNDIRLQNVIFVQVDPSVSMEIIQRGIAN